MQTVLSRVSLHLLAEIKSLLEETFGINSFVATELT